MNFATNPTGFRHKLSLLPRKLRHEWEKLVYLQPFVKKNQHRDISPDNTLCLFAIPRSGSTWLADMLHQLDKSVLLNEPLITAPNPIDLGKAIDPLFVRTEEVRKLGFHYLQPIPHCAEWPEAKHFFQQLLSGRIPSRLLYDLDSGHRILHANNLIAHFNHANLLAAWLQQQFDFKSIVLLRHPCAVVGSQVKYPNIGEALAKAPSSIADFRHNDLFKSEQNLITKLESKEQFLAFLWAIQVREILYRNPEINRMLVVHYEHLVANFEAEIKRVFDWVGREVPESVWQLRSIPSKSVLDPGTNYRYDAHHLEKWKNELTASQVQQILEVVREMGVAVYGENTFPEVRG